MIPRYTSPEMGALWTDEAKYAAWLQIELLVCEALHRNGKIPSADWNRIRRRARFDARRIDEIEARVRHDVIAFLTNVGESVGPSSRYIHRGLTSSDILDTALAVLMVRAADILIRDVRALRRTVAAKARRYRRTPMMGRTHGVHAEPITFGLKMALMYDEFGRALDRLLAARGAIAVGKLSGAVGTHAHLPPRVESFVCRKLGLRPAAISTQIIQRDRHAQYLSALALVGTSVERWAQEFRHLQRTEVLEVEEGFGADQKGSSAMPHKKNPITGEKLCGLARLLRGHALAAMENVALWHERDISHSSVERIIIPDSTIALDHMLREMNRLVGGLQVYPDRMLANLRKTAGLICSQPLLLLLTEKGFSRDEAYRRVQRHALESWQSGVSLRSLVEGDSDIAGRLTAAELDRVFDLSRHFRYVDYTFQAVGL